jgi:plastocyanin
LGFDPTTLTAAAGAEVTVQYTNDSTLPHNWHLFDGPDTTGASIAQTPVNTGPGNVSTVQFTAPTQPGSYYFQCDIHPTIMTGQLVVN